MAKLGDNFAPTCRFLQFRTAFEFTRRHSTSGESARRLISAARAGFFGCLGSGQDEAVRLCE